MSKKIKFDCKDKVKSLLEQHPHLRDDDNKLIATYWYKESKHKGFDANKQSAFDLLSMVSKGELTNMQSISRARRKLQELNPQLRGSSYKEKQTNQENIKDQLKNF